MKKVRKFSSLFVMCILCVLVSSACGKMKTEKPEVTAEVQTEEPVVSTPETTQEAKVTENSIVTTVPIYSINDETLEIEDTVAELPEGQKVDAEFIVKEVVKSFADHGIEIGIYSVIQKEKGVYVSFEKDKAPVEDVGSTVEYAILNSISQSLLDNLDTCEKVYFKIEDGPYESGHFVFEEDEPYNWK